MFITDISKFSKVSIFSSLNKIEDIFIDEDFSSIVGYTQDELEYYFSYWIDYISSIKNISSDQLLLQMKDYYDGFLFDGHLKLYNPFSIFVLLYSLYKSIIAFSCLKVIVNVTSYLHII